MDLAAMNDNAATHCQQMAVKTSLSVDKYNSDDSK